MAQEEATALNVVQQLKTINAVTMAILKEARDEKKNGMALFAIDRVQKQIELQAKLLGDLDERPQITITNDPQWIAMRELIFKALAPYPQARYAVAAALLEEGQRGQRIS